MIWHIAKERREEEEKTGKVGLLSSPLLIPLSSSSPFSFAIR